MSALPRHLSGEIADAQTSLGSNGACELPEVSVELPAHPLIDRINEIWDMNHFKTPNAPLAVGRVSESFSDPLEAPKVSDLPIKFPGSDYRLPRELAPVAEAIAVAAAAEEQANPRLDEFHSYLTIDQRPVTRSEIQRGGGAHSDSVQGPRIQPKVIANHGYVCLNFAPTAFYVQGWDLQGVDVNKHWLNQFFEQQKREDAIHLARPFEVTMFDAYCVHEAMPADQDGLRIFLRLIYSVRRFDRAGNTHNDLFDYDWEMRPRPFPAELEGLK